jgi:circadian clock protein KaiB
MALQEMLGLSEPPHFLVPAYTATIDRWLDPRTRQLRTSAEIYPLVRHHQALLNAVFGTVNMVWQLAPCQEGLCDLMVVETYRHQFPQLWEDHDLVVRFDRTEQFSYTYPDSYPSLRRKEASVTTLQNTMNRFDESILSDMEVTSSDVDVSAKQDTITQQDRVPNESSSTPSNSVSVISNTDTSLPLTNTLGVSDSVMQGSSSNEAAEHEDLQGADLELAASGTSPRDVIAETVNDRVPATDDTLEQVTPPLPPARTTSHSDSNGILPDSQSQYAQGYVLRLFVSGHSAATEHTLMSLHQLLETSLRFPYTLKVIDVFKHPDQAEMNQISATPTLLRVWPEPIRRIVGDLTDSERILRILATPES